MLGCLWMRSRDLVKWRVTLSRGVRILFVACVVALSLSCRTVIVTPPPCPIPSEGVVGDLTEMVVLDEYEYVRRWIAEMERYCDGIEAMSD